MATTTYRMSSSYGGMNCTGTLTGTSYWPVGECFNFGGADWVLYTCNSTGTTATSCADALCSVNCTTDAWTPLGCSGTSSYGCTATVPAPAADSVVTRLYTDDTCTTPSEILHTPVGCQTYASGTITRTVGCNSSFTWSADCSSTTCAVGTCTSFVDVNPNAPCTRYHDYAWAKRECIPPSSSAAPSAVPSNLAAVLTVLLATIVAVLAGPYGYGD